MDVLSYIIGVLTGFFISGVIFAYALYRYKVVTVETNLKNYKEIQEVVKELEEKQDGNITEKRE